MTVREGRCRFVMDLKSFDLSVEVVGGKLRGIIKEKGRGLSTWIRFSELSLHYLLEGVKAYYRVKSWRVGISLGRRVRGSSSWSGIRMRLEGFCYVQF